MDKAFFVVTRPIFFLPLKYLAVSHFLRTFVPTNHIKMMKVTSNISSKPLIIKSLPSKIGGVLTIYLQ